MRKRSASLSPATKALELGIPGYRDEPVQRRHEVRVQARLVEPEPASVQPLQLGGQRPVGEPFGLEEDVERLDRRWARHDSDQPSSREIAAVRSSSSGSAAFDRGVVEARARALQRDDRLELSACRANGRRDRAQPGLALAGRRRVAALPHPLELPCEQRRGR